MKKGQVLVLIILLIIMSIVVWLGACKKTKEEENNPTGDPQQTDINLNSPTPTLPPDVTPSPVPDNTPVPGPVVFPEIKESDFADYSSKGVEWDAGFYKDEESGTTSAWYNSSLDKYIKGHDYVFTKNDSTEKREIYLTFNISWDKDSLTRILDILKTHNQSGEDKVYVTFFVQSDCLDWTDLMKRIFNEGHQLAIRAFPDSMAELPVKEIESKLLAIEAKYRTLFGNNERMYFYRPGDEFSTREIAAANALGYKVVFYCYKYRDWDTEVYNATGTGGKTHAGRAILDNFHDGSVIQLLVSELNADVLNYVITEGLSQGFSFERLDQ